MEEKFVITEIKRVVMVGKNEYSSSIALLNAPTRASCLLSLCPLPKGERLAMHV